MYINSNISNGTIKPQFSIYAKRKSAQCGEAVLYMRIAYQFVIIDKSLGIKVDPRNNQVNPSSVHTSDQQPITGNA